jgi:hypothetical protein
MSYSFSSSHWDTPAADWGGTAIHEASRAEWFSLWQSIKGVKTRVIPRKDPRHFIAIDANPTHIPVSSCA